MALIIGRCGKIIFRTGKNSWRTHDFQTNQHLYAKGKNVSPEKRCTTFVSTVYKKVGDEVVLSPDMTSVTAPITSIMWKVGPNIAVQWEESDESDITYFRHFKGMRLGFPAPSDGWAFLVRILTVSVLLQRAWQLEHFQWSNDDQRTDLQWQRIVHTRNQQCGTRFHSPFSLV